MRIRTVLVAAALALLAVACGGDDDTSDSERPDIEDAETATETPIETAVEPTPTAVVEEVDTIGVLTYEVASGDTLGSIADDFGVPLGALIDINQFENPDFIGIGDEVVIPTEEEIDAWEAAQAGAAEEPAAEEPAADEPTESGDDTAEAADS